MELILLSAKYLDYSSLNLQDIKNIYADARHQIALCFRQQADHLASVGMDDISDIFRKTSERNLVYVRTLKSSAESESGNAEIRTALFGQLFDERYNYLYVQSTYEAWAFVVSQEVHFFDSLSVLTARTENPVARQWLLSQCKESLTCLRFYRLQRRSAYHASKSLSQTYKFPKVQRIVTVEDFRFVAVAIENWFLKFLRQVAIKFSEVNSEIIRTKNHLGSYFNDLRGIEPPKGVRRSIKSLESEAANFQVNSLKEEQLRLIAMAEARRVFDYYDEVFQSTKDSEIMQHAQNMSVLAVKRLRSLGQSIDTSK